MSKLPKGAIGYQKDLSEDELVGKHVDGLTGLVFETEEDYLNHKSPVTGFTPKDVEHQDALTGGQFSKQAEKALERGEARKE